ncbi:unnamed protein product [Arabidopsis lyrata]|nr:unnamed protein product [Arabidopsis lyrata]
MAKTHHFGMTIGLHREFCLMFLGTEVTLISGISATREARKIDEEDVHLWKWRTCFKKSFSTRETWMLIREERPKCDWANDVWFPQATPKYAFITWLAMHNRLATGDRMMKWNQTPNTACVLCQAPMETTNHLFFHRRYSKQVWGKLMKGILQNKHTTDWNQLGQLATSATLDHRSQLLLRYTLQATTADTVKNPDRIRNSANSLTKPFGIGYKYSSQLR